MKSNSMITIKNKEMETWNIEQFNAIGKKYVYIFFEKYSQFINTYDDLSYNTLFLSFLLTL
jgi:hypothetical protein